MSLAINHVSKQFDTRTILRDFSLQLPDHGLCIIAGPSGSGKTTLLRIIAGIENTDGGLVAFNGRTSMSFQEYRLFPQLNALQNATAFIPSRDIIHYQSLAIDMLKHLEFHDEQLLLQPHALSGGMKQRVSLVRALCGPYDLVLLDEPLKELDRHLQNTVTEMIVDKSKHALIIMTAHDAAPFIDYACNIVTLPIITA